LSKIYITHLYSPPTQLLKAGLGIENLTLIYFLLTEDVKWVSRLNWDTRCNLCLISHELIIVEVLICWQRFLLMLVFALDYDSLDDFPRILDGCGKV
jgi:hypothetical protein